MAFATGRRSGSATGVFALAFLLMGIGVLLEVAAAPDNGFNSTKIAVLWLAVAFALGNAIASACAAFGFSSSSSSEATSLMETGEALIETHQELEGEDDDGP